MTFFRCKFLKFVSMNNQECKIKPEIILIISNKPVVVAIILITVC